MAGRCLTVDDVQAAQNLSASMPARRGPGQSFMHDRIRTSRPLPSPSLATSPLKVENGEHVQWSGTAVVLNSIMYFILCPDGGLARLILSMIRPSRTNHGRYCLTHAWLNQEPSNCFTFHFTNCLHDRLAMQSACSCLHDLQHTFAHQKPACTPSGWL